jgi:hypothetical protein
VEWSGYLERFVQAFAIPLSYEDPAGSMDELFAQVVGERRRVFLIGADMPASTVDSIRSVPLVDPVPVYPWSVVWPRHPHPATLRFVEALVALGGAVGGAGQWVPDVDRAALAAPSRVGAGHEGSVPLSRSVSTSSVSTSSVATSSARSRTK